MAVQEDYIALKALVLTRGLAGKADVSIMGCSLDARQIEILRLLKDPVNINRQDWDLNKPGTRTADIIVLCNVFHYSPDPALWFKNVLACCKELWITDIICRRRGGNSELGADGDAVRYSLGGVAIPEAKIFYLDDLEDKLQAFWTYDAGSFRAGHLCINFVAAIKGDL